jgi:hypothetical protein
MGGLLKAVAEAGEDCVEGPAQGGSAMNGAIGDSMDDFNDGLASNPAEERNTAAFGSEIDGDAGG